MGFCGFEIVIINTCMYTLCPSLNKLRRNNYKCIYLPETKRFNTIGAVKYFYTIYWPIVIFII